MRDTITDFCSIFFLRNDHPPLKITPRSERWQRSSELSSFLGAVSRTRTCLSYGRRPRRADTSLAMDQSPLLRPHEDNCGTKALGANKLTCPTPISRLRVEKIEGGLMVAGVVVAANCQIILPIFGFLFLLVGCVLTAASYRGPGEDEEPDHYAARIAFTGNSRILGPACIVVGVFMLVAGFVLCVLTRRARRREQTIGFHCPLHGDFYPLSPITGSRTVAAIERGDGSCMLCWPRKRGPGAIAVGPPQCPHSQISSTRSSLASSPHSQCPTPQPFLVTSGSVGGLVPVAAQLSPDQPFGSIRSLTTGREVASFPLSRTPTPPPSVFERAPNLVQVPDEEKLVETSSERVHRNGPRKSVSIVLPSEDKG